MPHHVFVDFLLQINPDCAIRPDDFVRANAGVGRNISPRIRNANVVGNITNTMMSALHRRRHEPAQKLRATIGEIVLRLGRDANRNQPEKKRPKPVKDAS